MIQGSPAYFKPVRSGQSTIAAGQTNFLVADTAITANSMVICCCVSNDATANSVAVDNLIAGASFTLRANANATAPTLVNWWVLAY
jgi:hypothetical protein